MSEQPQRPTTDNRADWRAYWAAQGMSWWRTEPEVDEERQRFLAERRAIQPDIERGIYPFIDIELTRADVEWLLATHESGGMRGPVDWSDEKQRQREGLDLRGAILTGADLKFLPLARLLGGLPLENWEKATDPQRAFAAIALPYADLRLADLAGAILNSARLGSARLDRTDLENAELVRASLSTAHLTRANLVHANLKNANLVNAHLEGANLEGASLENALLWGTHVGHPDLNANLRGINLKGADLRGPEMDWPELARAGPKGIRLPLWTGELPEASPSDVVIRVMEDPLTARNLTTILSALTGLYTKCWLIYQGRLANLIAYTQTHDARLDEDANLVVSRISHNSPADFTFRVGFKELGEALEVAIKAVAQARYKGKEAELANQAKDLDNQAKQLELRLKAAEGRAAAQHAQLALQRKQLAIQKAQLDIEKEQLSVQVARLEVEHKRWDTALELAAKIVEGLQPWLDEPAKAMAVQSLLPTLLQLGISDGLELVLPNPEITVDGETKP
jgi:uncharacterized protein YjbI with pentapeptide repeats